MGDLRKGQNINVIDKVVSRELSAFKSPWLETVKFHFYWQMCILAWQEGLAFHKNWRFEQVSSLDVSIAVPE